MGRQAQESERFSLVSVNTDRSLEREHSDFFNRHCNLLKSDVRGYGYWIWKPYLINYALRSWGRHVDYVLYVDSGCEINAIPESQKRWIDYLNTMNCDTGRLVMQMNHHAEHVWSKNDTLTALGLDWESRISGQILSGVAAFRVDEANVQITQEWLDLCILDNHHLLDDTASRIPNHSEFREHRHDQAIFSGLIKLHGSAILPDETYWAPNWEFAGREFPIWAARNRTRVSVRDRSFFGKILRLVDQLNQR